MAKPSIKAFKDGFYEEFNFSGEGPSGKDLLANQDFRDDVESFLDDTISKVESAVQQQAVKDVLEWVTEELRDSFNWRVWLDGGELKIGFGLGMGEFEARYSLYEIIRDELEGTSDPTNPEHVKIRDEATAKIRGHIKSIASILKDTYAATSGD
jgi:hypothetical protein